MTKLTIEKDDFTGFKKIYTPIFNLEEFNIFSDVSVMRLLQNVRRGEVKIKHNELSLKIKLGHDVSEDIKNLDTKNITGFDLIYVESEDGQGKLSIRVYTMLFDECKWPGWLDEWPMIANGNRILIKSEHIAETLTDLEFKVYDLPIDIFSQLANSQEVKYSLRGKSEKIDGVFSGPYIKVFQAFEHVCFNDENEGMKLFEAIELENNKYKGVFNKEKQEESKTYCCYSCKADNLVPNSWESFNCHNCKKDNTIVKPKNLSEEEKNNHEKTVINLIKEKKIVDAIKYYISNFGVTENLAKNKVKELAEKSGHSSIYTNFSNKKFKKRMFIGLLVSVFFGLLMNVGEIYNIIYGGSDSYSYSDYSEMQSLNNSTFLFILIIIGLIMFVINLIRLSKNK